jgi:hypothetical protein
LTNHKNFYNIKTNILGSLGARTESEAGIRYLILKLYFEMVLCGGWRLLGEGEIELDGSDESEPLRPD